jgi:hypothetical protein
VVARNWIILCNDRLQKECTQIEALSEAVGILEGAGEEDLRAGLVVDCTFLTRPGKL